MSEQDDSGFSFQDNRRIDPENFAVREPQGPAPEGVSANVDDAFAEIVDGIVVEGEPESADAKVAELQICSEFMPNTRITESELIANEKVLAIKSLVPHWPSYFRFSMTSDVPANTAIWTVRSSPLPKRSKQP